MRDKGIMESVVSQDSIPNGAVAMTKLGAAFTCYCCEADAGCGIKGILIIAGEMLLPATVTRKPAVDCSVVDTASARRHEYSWHIDPAKAAAEAEWAPYDSKFYSSKAACDADYDKLKKNQRIAKKFLSTIRVTQNAEKMRARTAPPCP